MNDRHPRSILPACAIAAVLALCSRASAGPGGCEPAIPPAGPDRVFSNLRSLEVVGLYKTLWSFRARQLSGNGPIVDRLATNGHAVEVRTTSLACTNLGAASAWSKPWSCALALEGRFALKKLTYRSIVRGGDGVDAIATFNPVDLATTDTIVFDETLNFDWDAGHRRLTVSVTYPGGDERNQQRSWGAYAILARSLTGVAVPAAFVGAVGAMTDAAFPLYANAGATQDGPTSIVEVHLWGHPFWADRGQLTFTREPPGSEIESFFAIEMVWGTDAWMDLSGTVAHNVPACGGGNAQTVSVSGVGLSSDLPIFTPSAGGFFTAFESGAAEHSDCVPWADPLVSEVRFHAGDAFAASCGTNGCPRETVGARFLAKLHTLDQRNGTCERWYDLGSTLLVNWALSMQTPGGETGGGFDIGAGTAVRDWASAHHFDGTYPCP